jgi:hypothetical protein
LKKINSVIAAILLASAPGPSFAQDAKKTPNLNIQELGFSNEIARPAPDLERTLKDREYYLRQHQIWGLLTTGAMAAALLSGGEGNLPPEHPFLAGLAVTAYGAAAYTAWKAPDLPGGKISGGSAWHRRLAWVHFPGMVLTPVLGYIAAKKMERGEKLDGVEKYHKDAAGITTVALALAVLSVSFEF